ncbi:putative sugar kinase [Stanieria sp. NIES-3757]|nr:putative sugar kinase [Stanieria sp. NIES-3757]
MKFQGLFVGLTTLDLIYLVANLPQSNQKIVALEQTIASGGPATNAAITFSCLGNQAKLMSIVGKHPLCQLIYQDLKNYSVEINDLAPSILSSPPVSSIFVPQSTGERAVVSINATKIQARVEQLPENTLQEIDVVLIDGHQIIISEIIAKQAKLQNIPIVIDGGSWKPGLEKILPYADYVICSADFYPPNCRGRKSRERISRADVFTYLKALHIPHIAITNGAEPIQYFNKEDSGEIPIKQVKVLDTLGAGDIFHGAFCHYILQQEFLSALTNAATIASNSCQFFGTRQFKQFIP